MQYVYSLEPPIMANPLYFLAYMLAFVCFAALLFVTLQREEFSPKVRGTAIIGGFLGAVGFLFLGIHLQSIYIPVKPETVIGTKVGGYEATTRELSGRIVTYVPREYVVYATPDGSEVSFKRAVGVVYPKNVILYKTPR